MEQKLMRIYILDVYNYRIERAQCKFMNIYEYIKIIEF